MGGGSQQSTQSTQTFQQLFQTPYFQDLYNRSQQDAQQQKGFFPGQNYASMSESTRGGIAGINQIAQQGTPGLNAASGYQADVLAGNYLNNNPYLDQTFDAASRGVTRAYRSGLAGTQSAFDMAGRGASGSAMSYRDRENDRFAGNLNELATSIYGGNYQQERGRMDNAASGAAGVEAGILNRYGASINAGSAQEQLQREQISGDMQRFDFGQNELSMRLGKYQQLLGGPVMENRGEMQSSGWNMKIL